jgi:colanic acid biosynthesis glycosyl transferase WcaI
MMHILMMAQHFAPEEVSGAVLATELATDLVERGHTVSFVTCAPNYPQGRVFPGYNNRMLAREMWQGVRVVRTWSYISPPIGFWRRLLNYGSFSTTTFYGGMAAGKPDVILSYSPPLPLGVSAWALSHLWRVPWVLRVEDLYPDAAVAAGVLHNRQAIGFFYALEKWLYRRASHISLISEGFRQALLAKGVAAEKLSVTPVWADPQAVMPLPRQNAFRANQGLTDEFVVMYAGNLGHASAMEDVIEAAFHLREREDICFLMIGEGVKKVSLQQFAADRGLTNVRFLPYQPREAFADMMAAADVSLVTLNAQSSGTSLPSKTFNIMASARPILAVTPNDSDIARLVVTADCGVSVLPGAPKQLAEAILALQNGGTRLAEMGRNGRRELEAVYSRQVCVAQYEATLRQAAAG